MSDIENMHETLEEAPIAQESSEIAPVPERDELDDIIDKSLASDESSDDEEEDEDDGGEGEGGTNEDLIPEAPKKKRKARDRVKRLAEQREVLRRDNERLIREAEYERQNRLSLEKAQKELLDALKFDEPEVQEEVKQPSFKPDDIEKMVDQKVNAILDGRAKVEENRKQIGQLQDKWSSDYKTAKETTPHVTSWFDEFTNDIERNGGKRELLHAIANFPYKTQALHAASKVQGFNQMNSGGQIDLIYSISQKIAYRQTSETRAPNPVNVPTTGRSNSIYNMSNEDFLKNWAK